MSMGYIPISENTNKDDIYERSQTATPKASAADLLIKEEKKQKDKRIEQYIYNNPAFDSVTPLEIVRTAITVGYKKALSTSNPFSISILQVFLKAMMSGAYLGFGITLTTKAKSVGYDGVTAACFFAMGFVLLILMGNDLATGNFALLPMAYLYGYAKPYSGDSMDISLSMIFKNWCLVYIGNFAGSLLYLFLLWGGMTHFGEGSSDELNYDDFKDALCETTRNKVSLYQDSGASGWFAAVFNGILCNWMVTLAVLLSFSSKSTIGRIFAMYFPITLFITLGFEHSIVNLFLLPAGIVYDCNHYNTGEWWIWNQIPVTFGNIIGGAVLTGIVYFVVFVNKI